MFPRHLLALGLVSLAAVAAQAQSFRPVGSVPLGQSTSYAIADFNLDGRPDLARAAAFTGKLSLFFGSVNGAFLASPNGPTDIDTPTGLVAGDFDNDGRPDVVVLSSTLFSAPSARVMLNLGTGAFLGRLAYIVPDLIRAAAAGDFDLDGHLDVAIVSSTPNGTVLLSVLRGNGRGDLAFAPLAAPLALPVPAFSIIGNIQALDLNGDRRADLIMTVSNTSNAGLVVALGDGRGAFAATASLGNQPPDAGSIPRMALADFNGDRAVDVVMFGYLRDRVTLFSNSNGILSPQVSPGIGGTNLYGIAAADFDLDGRTDWAVTPSGATGELNVALGTGGSTFFSAPGNPYPYGGPAPLLETGDFNGDRRVDLLVGEGDSQSFLVLLNDTPRAPTLAPQVIQFPQPADRGLNDGNLTITVSTSSGLPAAVASLTNPVCVVSKGIATFVGTGVCTIVALQPGDYFYSAAPVEQRSFNVTRNTQTITFAALADRTLDASPFTVSATASSGLAVLFSAGPSTVCTVTGSVVTLVATGQCSITASQPGNATFPAAAPVTRTFAVTPVVPLGPSIESIANAASYVSGTLAPNSYGVLFGQRLTPPVVTFRDAGGTQRTLELIFSGPTQINFIVPANAARGAGTIVVTTPAGAAEFPVTIAATAPGLFSANGTGQGLAAAQALIVNNDKTITTLTVADGPIPVLGGTEIYLVLYGTGIRAHTATGVFATVGGLAVEILYAGPQGTYPALDQVNLRIPLTVAGFGPTDIRLTVDGVTANIVTARFQ